MKWFTVGASRSMRSSSAGFGEIFDVPYTLCLRSIEPRLSPCNHVPLVRNEIKYASGNSLSSKSRMSA